jgi:pyruvate dehydrogenase E1 component beta subunit
VLASIRKTGLAIIVHEAVREFGVGAEIAATIQEEAFNALKGPIKRLGAPLTPAPFADLLEQAYLVNADQIAAAARKAMATN